MLVTKDTVLGYLPKFTNDWVKVVDRQDVSDIINLMVSRHYDFASDYDKIGPLFIGKNLHETCDNLYDFCATNILYKEETEARQSVASPAAIVSKGKGDCKHYASFIGGCLDAISRYTGKKIDWYYCFASYDWDITTPYHVFVVVDLHDGQPDLYIDPTPGADGKEPVYITKEYVTAANGAAVNGLGELEYSSQDENKIGAANPNGISGTLIPAPVWYPANLPKFYRQSTGQIWLRPFNTVPNYTQTDVLDCAIYYQMIIGYNRTDTNNATTAAWKYRDGTGGGEIWIKSAFKTDGNGNGSGDFSAVSPNGRSTDGAFYSLLQQHYVERYAAQMPWLKNMAAKGAGVDLMTIPMSTDTEIPRPKWYLNYLPSLFISAGEPYQAARGTMNTKPKLLNWKITGYTQYTVTPVDIANLMLYAQPIINEGPTPYPLNWYINDDVNGAMANFFKITLAPAPGHTNSQMQGYGINGDMMKQPDLDADPFTSGFGHTLQTIVSAAINFFAGKIPGGAKLVTAAYYAGNISGGELVTGGPVPPGVFSAAVFAAANALNTKIKTAEKNKNYLLIGLAVLGALAYYYKDDIKKYL